ncbi:cyclic nucleotide-binding domain-containing protein [Limibaculum sp. FT325]|uniref:Crp/Fnr family transcriptional regulator n=1 Tax=Thermohalobaculum sediminis TaxID=2939436 RepID=UPI0020C06998|nr:cyclic nucleotide-binding domain-containing protein [Limibaculum sediminis]MCL5777667.1 cyclic nucleotide-binding domain-containing protein [Limibaculum sediminis]
MNHRALRTAPACEICNVHHLGLFAALGERSIDALGRISHRRQVPAGRVISSEGAPSREVHCLISGLVRLSKLLPDGREQIVGLMHPSDFLGCTFAETCSLTAVAIRDTELCSFDKAAFEALLRKDPDIEHALLTEVLHELDAARDWMVVLGRKSGIERVASFLLFVIRRADKLGCRHTLRGTRPVYELPLTRVDIGHFLGLSLETVSRQISRLVADGVIELIDPRRFRVRDIARLEELAATGESVAG